MDGISNDNNLRYDVEIHRLVDATPDSKEFYFSACDVNHVMNHLCYRFVIYMHMQDRSCNVILDAHIRCYDSNKRGWGGLQNHFVKLMGAIFIVFFFVMGIEWNMIWKIVNYSKSRRKQLREIKDGKHSLDLLAMLTKWPLMSKHCRMVRESRVTVLWLEGVLCCKSIREYIRWLGGSLWAHSCDLLLSFWRWSLIGISPAMASIPYEVL